MKFRRLEVYGFKAFADRTKLDFQDGMTAIVGPNGCGKSNVVDAIRWVLAERSPKLLRGKSMQDVIFNGTERRKAMSYCEVSLTFNNEGPDRIFKTLEFDEVKITRKLYKNGGSEFYINDTPARMTDIIALVRETGLGREGYSIVRQGKIQEIIDAKPEARRALFEDAAGVLSSKIARREALANLAAYEVNKQQLEALLAEIERNVNTLERKAEAAKKYMEIMDELRTLEANSYVFQKDNQAAQVERIKGIIDSLEKEIEGLNEELEKKSAEFEKITTEQAQLDILLTNAQNEQTELAVKKENLLGKGNTYSATKEGYLTTKNDYSIRLTKLEEELEKINAQYRENYSKMKMAEEEKVDVQEDYNAAVKRQTELNSEINEREQALENKNSEITKLLESVGDIKKNFGKIEAQKQATLDRIAEYDEEIKDLNDQVDNNETIKDGFETSVSKLKDQKDRLEETITKLNNRYGELEKLIENARTRTEELSADYQSCLTRKNMLEQIINSKEGYAGPVQRLLKEAKVNEYVRSRVIGVVADLIQVPEKIQLAIEVALGNALQNIVVKDEYSARDLINFQKQNGIGRITFLPLSSYRTREIDPQCRNIVNERGCLGVASKLIKYDSQFNNIFSGLLGNTVVCENVDIGIDLARKYSYQVKIVTLDGEVFNTTGSIVGGSKNATFGILSQETQYKEAKEKLVSIKQEFEDLKIKYKEHKEEYEDLAEQIEEYESEAEEANNKYIQENSRYEAIVDILVDLNKRLEDAKHNKGEAEKQFELYAAALAKVDKQNQDISLNREDINSAAQEGKEVFAAMKKEKTEIDAKVTNLGVQFQNLVNNIEWYKKELERLDEEKDVTKQNIEQCKEILSSSESNIKSVESKMKSTVMSEEDKKRLAELDTVINQYIEKKRELIEDSKRVSNEKASISQRVLESTHKKDTNEKRLISIDERMRNLEEKIMEDYGLDYNSALQYKDENFDFEGAQDRIKSLKASKNALGPVDPTSVDSYREEKQRYDEKHVEYEDLLKAEEDLRKIIDDLSKEILEKFNTEFEKISTNFQEIFKELFAGGSGRISIKEPEEGQDPLDAGIEIFAQPPGKRVQDMSLLSGGEQALTAIALLFAILRLRPLPFCLLDEVEAALDEGNVGVYAKFLKKFSNETQFVVITHRKPTMERADKLLGITMQEKGVSKVVEVSLEDAVKHSRTGAEKLNKDEE